MSIRRWIQDHPRPLEWAYRYTELPFAALDPLFARVGYMLVEATQTSFISFHVLNVGSHVLLPRIG
jgi:hypothetical protein